jgi:hypothetical protein
MMPIQHGKHQGFNSTPTREPMHRMGRDKAVNHGGHLQAPSDSQDQRHVCYGMNLLYCRSHDVPPVVADFRQHHSVIQTHTLAGLSPE